MVLGKCSPVDNLLVETVRQPELIVAWFSVPHGLIPYRSQQAETRAFSRCWTTHSFSAQGYLHFVLHSVLLEQVSPRHL